MAGQEGLGTHASSVRFVVQNNSIPIRGKLSTSAFHVALASEGAARRKRCVPMASLR